MASGSDGSVIIDTNINADGFNDYLTTAQNGVNGLGAALKKLGKVIATTFAVGKLIQFGKESIELGSDLQEVQNVVDVVFTSMSDKVNEFAQNAAETAGLSETMAKKYVGIFGAMSKAFGFTEESAYEMSTSLTQLAGDTASFYNITQDEAYTKLKSVFTGETESLKDLGVVMTQSALDSYALAEGYGKTTAKMSEQEKVALRYKFIMNQLSTASGDFLRTSDGWANQIRVLKLSLESLKATIGQGLINMFTPVVKVLNVVIGKLQTIANAFRAFSELLVGKQTSGGGGSSGEAAEELADLQSGYEGVADATETASKQNKKYLSGLDEIKTFQDGSASDGGDIGVGDISFESGTGYVDDNLEETESMMERLAKKARELSDIFQTGFTSGLGDTTARIESIKVSVTSVKESLASIFNQDLADGFNSCIERITGALGTTAGATASVGITIGTNLLGGLSGYLEGNKERIQQYLLDMFDIGAGIAEKVSEFSKSFAYIFEEFGSEDGQKLTENIIAIFSDSFMEVTKLAGEFGLDILSLIIDPFTESKDELKKAFGDLLTGLSEFTGSIRTVLDEAFGYVNQIYEEYISPIFDNLKPAMESLYKDHIAPLAEKLGGFFSKLGENINVLWNEAIKPFIEWFIANVMPVIAPAIEAVGKVFIEVFATIADVIGGIIDVISGIITFIVGIFTGDWERAWDGIKDIFSGIWDACKSILILFIDIVKTLFNNFKIGLSVIWNTIKDVAISTWEKLINSIKTIVSTGFNTVKNTITKVFNGIWSFIKKIINSILGGFEKFVNGIINAFNTMINAINKIKINIPDWVPSIGGKSLGFNLGTLSNVTIPKLATGAVIPPNAPFMAMLGDQKHGTNIEAPLSTIEQALENVLNRSGSSGNITLHNVMQVNRRTLYDEFIEEAKLRMSTTGRNPFDLELT